MQKETESQLITQVKELYPRFSLNEIQEKLGVSRQILFYIIGKAGLEIKHNRIQTITKVFWRNNAPNLRVSRFVVRKMALNDGDEIQWIIDAGKIIGIPKNTQIKLIKTK